MGIAKRTLEDQHTRYEEALQLLLEVGALKECEIHIGTYMDGSGDRVAAYKLANSRITAGAVEVPSGGSRKDVTDLIDAVYNDNSGLSHCPSCEKNARD